MPGARVELPSAQGLAVAHVCPTVTFVPDTGARAVSCSGHLAENMSGHAAAV